MLKRIMSVAIAAMALTAVANQKDIVDTAVSAGQFKTLVSLVKAADLVDTLKGDGPFTVLAPTDKAFAKLPKSLVKKLTGDKALLQKVLTYHVIPGKVLSTDLKSHMRAETVQGENVVVRINGKNVMFNKSKVVAADIVTSNGVIHAIDTVLLPPSLSK